MLDTAAILTLDDQHVYRLGGRELISNTQALTTAGFIDSRWFTEESAIRGQYVHAAIQLHHEGDLEEDSLDPALQPYFAGYLRFLAESHFRIDACEERLCDLILGCAGTLDLRGFLPPLPPGASSVVDVIDVKTGGRPSWVGYQTAGYLRMLPASMVAGRLKRRWCLALPGDGSYRLDPLTKRSDEQVFLAALTVAQAKRGWL